MTWMLHITRKEPSESDNLVLPQYPSTPLSLPTSSPLELYLTILIPPPSPLMPSGQFFSYILQIPEAQAERQWLSCLLHHREE